MTREEKQIKIANKYNCLPDDLNHFSNDTVDAIYSLAFDPQLPLTEEEIEYGKKLAKEINRRTR